MRISFIIIDSLQQLKKTRSTHHPCPSVLHDSCVLPLIHLSWQSVAIDTFDCLEGVDGFLTSLGTVTVTLSKRDIIVTTALPSDGINADRTINAFLQGTHKRGRRARCRKAKNGEG